MGASAAVRLVLGILVSLGTINIDDANVAYNKVSSHFNGMSIDNITIDEVVRILK